MLLMITDPRLKAMASARLKHNEAINDIRFTDGTVFIQR